MTRVLPLLCLCALPIPAAADSLTSPAPIGDYLASLPRMTGDSAVAARVNAALDDLDRLQRVAITCEGTSPDGAFRAVEVLSDGPDLLSLLISTGGACDGAAYPWGKTETVNFDLINGQPTDLMPFLPPAWVDPGPPDTQLFDLYLGSVDLTAIEEDCADILVTAAEAGRLSYFLAVDTGTGSLMILPEGLLHLESGCELPAFAQADRLRAAGFAPRLIEALGGPP